MSKHPGGVDEAGQAQPVRGPVYLAFNTANPLPGLIVILPPPVGVRLDGQVDPITAGTRNTFASNPDLPVRSFTLSFEGNRPDAALRLTQGLCIPGTDLTMSVKLTAYNGKVSQFEDEELETAIERLARRLKYTVAEHDVVLRGSCPDCKK